MKIADATKSNYREKTAVKLAVTTAIPVGMKHANIITALAELISEFAGFMLDYDDVSTYSETQQHADDEAVAWHATTGE